MKLVFILIVSLSLVCLAKSISLKSMMVIERLDKNLDNAIQTINADMHFIDQLFEEIYKTDIDKSKIGENESRPFLAEGIAGYIDRISGGGPKRFVLLDKDETKKTLFRTEMDKDIYKNWYGWSVQNLCKRLVDAIEPVVDSEDLTSIDQNKISNNEIINKMKGCRNIVSGDLMENSFEMVKLLHNQALQVIKLP